MKMWTTMAFAAMVVAAGLVGGCNWFGNDNDIDQETHQSQQPPYEEPTVSVAGVIIQKTGMGEYLLRSPHLGVWVLKPKFLDGLGLSVGDNIQASGSWKKSPPGGYPTLYDATVTKVPVR